MTMKEYGHKVKGIAEIVLALADSPLVNDEALVLVSVLLEGVAKEMTEASNESR